MWLFVHAKGTHTSNQTTTKKKYQSHIPCPLLFQCIVIQSLLHIHFQVVEKWSSVRLSSDSKNRTVIENHVSTNPNLNLNGLSSGKSTKNLGQEVSFILLYSISRYKKKTNFNPHGTKRNRFRVLCDNVLKIVSLSNYILPIKKWHQGVYFKYVNFMFDTINTIEFQLQNPIYFVEKNHSQNKMLLRILKPEQGTAIQN